MKRTIVIGDIHGCYAELLKLLDRLAVTEGDRIISTGDLIVKGTHNREVLELFIADSRFSSALGNHDRALLRFWQTGKKLSREQEKCRRELNSDRERFASYLAGLQPFIALGSHAVVHAGVRPGIALSNQSLKDLTVLRTLGGDEPASRDGILWYEVYDDAPFIIFGHNPAREPRRGKQALGIDTGCVYGGRLTACILETGELVSVEAERA
jgi:diadenosine tetraphosphatase ApaH/serine/threonine PP2A family protein phosphatase